MLTNEEREHIGRMTQVMQIIVGALAFGVMSFLCVVLFAIPAAAPGERLLTYLSALFGFLAPAAAMFIPRLIESKQSEAIAAQRSGAANAPNIPESLREVATLVGGYQTRLIIRCALIEGAAFFAIVAFMIERQLLSLVVAGALLLALLSCFPTRSKVEDAVENERREIEQLRQMG
jgi:uncharacterized membrane protein YqjE